MLSQENKPSKRAAWFPTIRRDVELYAFKENNRTLIAFHDPLGLVPKGFALDYITAPLLACFDGRHRRDALSQVQSETQLEALNALETLLEEMFILETPGLNAEKERIETTFESLPIRRATCAGSSYPNDADAARALFDAAFHSHHAQSFESVKAVFAPHIDYRVGLHAYLGAFSAVKLARPKRIVLLATSHYAGMYGPLYDGFPVIASLKDFETPFGTVTTDKKSVMKLCADLPEAVSSRDRAHRLEHSVELHAVLLHYLLGNTFTLVPLLVTSFDDLLHSDAALAGQGKKIDAVANWLEVQFGRDEETIFCVSGDLAHIGRKFGDRKPAKMLLPNVQAFDASFISAATAGSSEALLAHMRSNLDAFRICGFPPLYLLLRCLKNLKGTQTAYQVWDEEERESAVTFSGIVFRE
jgi:AmmeMemoRadiSam system protein B